MLCDILDDMEIPLTLGTLLFLPICFYYIKVSFRTYQPCMILTFAWIICNCQMHNDDKPIIPGVPKRVYSSILGSIKKRYDVITLFCHTLLTKCLFTCVQNLKYVSCVSSELWTREHSPVKLGFVHKLPMLCTTM